MCFKVSVMQNGMQNGIDSIFSVLKKCKDPFSLEPAYHFGCPCLISVSQSAYATSNAGRLQCILACYVYKKTLFDANWPCQ